MKIDNFIKETFEDVKSLDTREREEAEEAKHEVHKSF